MAVRESRGERVLEAVGLTELEERAYQALVDHPAASLAELATSLEMSQGEVRGALRSLQAKGLVTHSPSRPRRYAPAPPDLAMEVLILRREEELERARLAAAELVERLRDATQRSRAVDLVEVVTGREAYAQRFLLLQRSARDELLSLTKPPYLTRPDDCVDAGRDALSRGLRYRTIYAREALELPGQPDSVREAISLGEQARALPDLPLKLSLADRELGLIPLNVEPGREQGVLVHASALLDALVMLFEMLWERAVPIRFPAGAVEPVEGDPTTLSEVDEAVLVLLSAGVKDKAIARQLGLGVSTVERRIKRLMAMLGAETRFQAGMQAAERRWLA